MSEQLAKPVQPPTPAPLPGAGGSAPITRAALQFVIADQPTKCVTVDAAFLARLRSKDEHDLADCLEAMIEPHPIREG